LDISIAMCTYNGGRFLEAQLASIGEQTEPPLELIICDDGSSDSTAGIVERFAATASFPVSFHRNPVNLGSTRNFERAMQRCRGEAIALCDQDDIWAPDKLAILAAFLDDQPAVAGVFSNAHLIDEETNILCGDLWSRVGFTPARQQRFNLQGAPAVLIHSDVVTGATFLFRSVWLPHLLPIPAEWVHDGWIALLLASLAKLQALPARPMSYRIHAAQQIGASQAAWHQHLSTRAEAAFEAHRRNAHRLQLITAKMEQLAAADEPVRSQVFLSSLHELRRKLRFLQRRAHLFEQSRFRRIPAALLLLPGYTRYEKGLMSLLRDMTHRLESQQEDQTVA
jgi:hypothetical protein